MRGLNGPNKNGKIKAPFSILRENLEELSLEAVIVPARETDDPGEGGAALFKAAGAKHVISASLDSTYRNSTGAEKEKALQESYRKAFKAAGELGCKTLGLPFPAWESYGIPKETELKVLEEEIRNFLLEHPAQIVLAVKEKKLSLVSGKLFDGIQNFIESNAEQEEDTGDILYSGPVPLGAVPVQGKPIQTRREYSHAPKRLLCEEPAPLGSVPIRRKPIHSRREYSLAPQKFLCEEPAECDTEIAGALPEADGIQDFIDSAGGKLNFQNTLQHLIADRKLDNATVYKKAFIDKKFFSKIISKRDYVPKKPTVMALGLALELEIRQYEDFLASAGYAFMPSSKFDLIIKYCVLNKIYNIISIDLILDSYGLPCFSPE